MTDSYRSADDIGERSTKDAAKDETARVANDAKARGADVADTARVEARNVADDARHQARQLFGEVRSEAYGQAGTQQQRVAEGLRGMGEEFDAMVRGSREGGAPSGAATHLASLAAEQMGTAANWLDQREPADVLHEVRRFARRNPGTFLAGAALLGLVAGRLTRSLTDEARSGNDYQDAPRGNTGGQRYGTDPQPAYRDQTRHGITSDAGSAYAPAYGQYTDERQSGMPSQLATGTKSESGSDYGTHNVDSVAPSTVDEHSVVDQPGDAAQRTAAQQNEGRL